MILLFFVKLSETIYFFKFFIDMIHETLNRCSVIKGLPWYVISFERNLRDVRLWYRVKVHFLWQPTLSKSIRMFMQISLRGRTRIRKIYIDILFITDGFPIGKLLAAVKNNGFE